MASPCLLAALTILSGNIDVEIKTILVLILDVRGDNIQVEGEPYWHHDLWHSIVDVLRADRRKMCGVLNPGPGRRRLWGHEAFFSHWRSGVGNTQVLVHGSQNLTRQGHAHTPELPILRVHGGVIVLTFCKAPAKAQYPQGHTESGATLGATPAL